VISEDYLQLKVHSDFSFCKPCSFFLVLVHKNITDADLLRMSLPHLLSCAKSISGIARISKLGDTPVTWLEGPMRGWNFWGGSAQRAPSPSARRSGGELSLPHPSKNLGFARILWPCLSTVWGVPPVPPLLRY